MKFSSLHLCVLLLVLFFTNSYLFAQQTDQELTKIILQRDSLFWKTYNTCDTVNMGKFLSNDLEFYHDKGGPSFGSAALLENFSKKSL